MFGKKKLDSWCLVLIAKRVHKIKIIRNRFEDERLLYKIRIFPAILKSNFIISNFSDADIIANKKQGCGTLIIIIPLINIGLLEMLFYFKIFNLLFH